MGSPLLSLPQPFFTPVLSGAALLLSSHVLCSCGEGGVPEPLAGSGSDTQDTSELISKWQRIVIALFSVEILSNQPTVALLIPVKP